MGARPSRDSGLARVWHVHSVGVVSVQGQRVIKAALRDSSAISFRLVSSSFFTNEDRGAGQETAYLFMGVVQ